MSTDATWPSGYDKLLLDETDSTMNEAQRRVSALNGHLATPLWIMTRRQTSGRGRRGRAWSDPTGNFAATLVMQLDEPPARIALRSFTAALALYDALSAATGLSTGLALKWPNDVLLNGGKLSGILLETLAPNVLALGIGINLRSAPPAEAQAGFAPVSLREEIGVSLTPETVFPHLAQAFAQWEDRLRTYGFDPVRNAFLAKATRLGETIEARTMRESHLGIFETIDENGALVLKTAQGRHSIPAADIFFP